MISRATGGDSGRRGRRLRVLALGMAATMALGAGTAQAADYQSTPTGSPGWVSAHTVAIATASTDVFSQALTTAAIGLDSLWLYPSPATAQTQIVTVRNTIRECGATYLSESKLAGQCQTAGSSVAAWYVKPGGWAYIGDKSALNVPFDIPQGWTYYARLTITWQTLSGYVLGQKVVNYRDAGDGACRSAQCSWSGAGPGLWVYGFTNL
jgi:hypothetical protein